MKHELLNKAKQKAARQCAAGPSWKQAVNFLSLALVIVFGFFSIVATGGGSSTTTSGEVSALSLPGRIELSKTDGGGAGGASVEALSAFPGMAFDDPGTDYTNQQKEVWVDDTDALDMVNSILGVCKETAYQNFVNQGPYKALVKPVSESEQSQGGSSTSSSTTESLMEVTLDVTRASNGDPMIIKIWVEESDGPGGMPMLIRGYFEVSAGVSGQYPYGQMEAHFKGTALNPDGSEDAQVFEMAMKVGAEAGDVVIQFVEDGGEGEDYVWHNKVRVVANETVTEGNAYVYAYENSAWDGEDEATLYYAFNENYLKEFDGEETEVLDKNDFEYIVYRYKLFRHDDGSKVTRNSGFPIQLAGGENAYIGYYGLWAPYGIQTDDGDTVTRPDTGEEYTLVKKGGKLKKHTKNQLTVSDLNGVEMSYWGQQDQTDYIITWDENDQKFKKIGERDQQTGQIIYYEAAAQEEIDDMNEWDGAWCEALKAYLPLGRLYANEGIPESGDILSYHAEEVVNPGTLVGDLTLYFWGFALDAPIDQAVIDGAPVAEAAYWQNPPVEKTYTFDATELVLKEGEGDQGDPVIIVAGLDLSGSIYTWGYNMMPLVTTQGCQDPWNEDPYYSWETGQNEWNQYATVKDSYGDYELFDAPLRLTYTHATANDINGNATHDGKVFNIEYDGFELHIPWEFDEDAGEWRPMINLVDGTVLSAGGTDYVVKGTEVGLDMQPVADPTVADDLIIDQTIQPPTLEYDVTKTELVGDRPAGAELKVIKGELI